MLPLVASYDVTICSYSNPIRKMCRIRSADAVPSKRFALTEPFCSYVLSSCFASFPYACPHLQEILHEATRKVLPQIVTSGFLSFGVVF